MSEIQVLSSSTSFRELLRKFRQEQASVSFMSWLIPAEEPSTSSSSSFWWENNTEKDDENSLEEFELSTAPALPVGECETCINEELDDASSPYWFAYNDQDSASFSSSFSQGEEEFSSDEESISSASSTYSDEPEEREEKYLPALGWWKVYRSGWWENSEGASTHFDEIYVEYRYSELLPSIPESEATSP